MNTEDKVNGILALLDEFYPIEIKCYLNYETPWQLLFATILSAQCTDDRVNMVTSDLFIKYKTLEDFATADLAELEQDVKSTGFYHNKAKNIILSARMLLEQYEGQAPKEMELLTKLPGVGRKTANLVRGQIYGIPGIVVDTHVKRVSYLLGLTQNTDPKKVEYDLMKILPEIEWLRYNPQIIAHGRKICRARRPECVACCLSGYCSWAQENFNKK